VEDDGDIVSCLYVWNRPMSHPNVHMSHIEKKAETVPHKRAVTTRSDACVLWMPVSDEPGMKSLPRPPGVCPEQYSSERWKTFSK